MFSKQTRLNNVFAHPQHENSEQFARATSKKKYTRTPNNVFLYEILFVSTLCILIASFIMSDICFYYFLTF